jgi:hypothetical protein
MLGLMRSLLIAAYVIGLFGCGYPALPEVRDAAPDCTNDTNPFSGHHYSITTTRTKWDEAYNVCRNIGAGRVVTMEGADEDQFVISLKSMLQPDSTTAWIGAHDPDGTLTYSWDNGAALVVTHWKGGEPSVSGGCVMMDFDLGAWVTTTCSKFLTAVCECDR